MGSKLYLKKEGNAMTFKVRVQPRSSNNGVVGLYGDALKIKLTAPPVDGKANATCLKFFSDLFNIPKSAIQIVSGKTGRDKKIRLTLPSGKKIEDVSNRLVRMVASGQGKA